MKKTLIVTYILLLIITNCLSAQSVDNTVTNLRSIYERNCTTKGLDSAQNNPEKITIVLQESEKLLIKQETDDYKKINSYEYLFKKYNEINNLEGQNRCIERIIFLSEKTNNYDIYLNITTYLANENYNKHNANEALKIYLKAEKYLKQKEQKEELCKLYLKMNELYSKQLNLSLAVRYLLKAQDIADESDDVRLKAETYSNIANYYFKENNPTKADKYLLQAKSNYEILNDEEQLACLGILYGGLLRLTGNNEKAIKEFEKSIQILENYNNQLFIGKAYNGIGECYENLGDDSSAIKNYKKGLKIRLEKTDNQDIEESYLSIGSYYTKRKQTDSAEYYLLEGFKIVKSQKKYDLINKSAMLLSNLYRKIEDYKKAYKYFSIANEYYDEITNKNSSKEIAQAEMEYVFEKERNFNKESAEHQEEIIKSKEKTIKITIILGCLIVFLTIVLEILYRKQIRKNKQINFQNDEISAQNEELKSTKEELLKQAAILEKNNRDLEKLSIVARQTDNSIFVTDVDGNITWINEAFARHSGYNIDNYLKHHNNSIFNASSNPKIKEVFNEIKQTKHSVTYTSKTQTKEGKDIWIQTNLSPGFDKDGNINQMIAVCSDITELKNAQNKIDEKNKEINDSLEYAKKIQDSIHPMKIFLNTVLNEYFIINIPKNIVSGDFYWVDYKNDCTIIAIADCTGHGIPGGFMSMLGQVTLSSIIANTKELRASEILNELRIRNIKLLHQRGKIGETQDGMDVSLCIINNKTNILNYAGAYSFTYLLRRGTPNEEIVRLNKENKIRLHIADDNESFLVCFKPDRMPIGIHSKDTIPFKDMEMKIQKGDILYLTTDGFGDQFGGENCKKLHTIVVEKKFIEYSALPMNEQKEKLVEFITSWRGENEQVDDIQIIGIEL